MKRTDYLHICKDKESLEDIFNRLFGLSRENEFTDTLITRAAMNVRRAIVALDGIITEQPAPPDPGDTEQPEQEKRLLSLTEEEVYMVTSCLSLSYKQKISLAIDNRGILPNTAIDEIFDDANKYDTLSDAIFEGNRDKK